MSGQFNQHYFDTAWHKREAEKDAKFLQQKESVENENSTRVNRNGSGHAKNNNRVGIKRRKR